MRVLAVDIGGTHVKYSQVDDRGTLTGQGQLDTCAREGGEALATRLEAFCARACAEAQGLSGIAISASGQVSPQDGSIRYATDNIPGWTGIQLKARIAEACGLPCHVENDVNAALLGEAWLGAARGAQAAFMLTLGTGIGGAALLNGKLLLGKHGAAAEIGHMQRDPHGPVCTCGQRGCYEQYAATAALERRMRVELPELDGIPALFAHAGRDARSAKLLDDWLDEVAWGVAAMLLTFDPDVVVVGGGVSAQGERISAPLQRLAHARVMPSFRDSRIVCAQLGGNAGMLGAAHAFFHRG